MRWLRTLTSALLLAAAPAVAAAQTRVQSGFNLFSSSQDAQIGKTSAAQVERQLPMVKSPRSNRLVQAVGARLARHAPGPDFDYRFKVVNASDLNAFALPGGYIYVNRGLIEQVRTEGQLAGVMAHEIAHVALRHQTSNLTRAYAARAGAGLVLGSLFGNSSTGTRNVVNAVGGFGLNSLFLKFSRTAERDADVLGAQIMAKAGYDPNELADFFALMRRKQGSNPSAVTQFLSSHPAPADREARIRSEARMLAHGSGARVGGLTAAQAELRAMPRTAPLATLQRNSAVRAGFAR